MIFFEKIFFFILVFIPFTLNAHNLDISKLINKAYQIEQLKIDSSSLSQKLKAYYFNSVKPFTLKNPCKTLTDSETRAILNLHIRLIFYFQSREAVRDYKECYDNAVERNINSEEMLTYLYKYMIKSRMFDEASKLSKSATYDFPYTPPVVGEEDDGEETIKIYAYRTSPNRLVRKELVFSERVEILVVASPMCHFCNRAIGDITTNDSLIKRLSEHSIWLIPDDGDVYFEESVKWNKKHPELKLHLMDKMEQFPFEEYWGTPTFYFLKSGKVIDQITGWPKDNSNLTKLTNKLEKYFPNM